MQDFDPTRYNRFIFREQKVYQVHRFRWQTYLNQKASTGSVHLFSRQIWFLILSFNILLDHNASHANNDGINKISIQQSWKFFRINSLSVIDSCGHNTYANTPSQVSIISASKDNVGIRVQYSVSDVLCSSVNLVECHI